MADDTRITLTKKLIAHLQEQANNGLPLHTQADELAQSGQLRPALHLCWSSMEIASRQNDDDYIFGAARLHMALAYFCAGTQEEWDRAAELCEQAAHHFEAKRALREQGIALLARAYILEALCDLNQDRWQQALRACAEGYTLLRQVTRHLGEEALEIYGALGRKYVEKGLADEAAAKSADASEAGSIPSDLKPNQTSSDPSENFGNSPKSDEIPELKSQTAYAGAHTNNGHNTAAYGFPTPNGNGAGSEHTTTSGNGASPKTDTTAKDPKKEPVPEPTPIPNGIKSKYAVLEKNFDTWRLGAVTCIMIAITFVLLMSAKGVIVSLEEDPTLGIIVAVGIGLSLSLIGLLCAILFVTSQLLVRLASDQIAVIIEGGRVWTIEGPGSHWLFPLRQDVVAIISQTPKKYQKFVPDVSLLQNRVLNANISADYLVTAPDQFWNRVLSRLPRSHVWGIPRPLSSPVIEAALDHEAHALLQSAVIEVANDPAKRRATAREERFNAEVCKFLQGEAIKDGIAFQHVSFRIMTSYADNNA